MALRGPLPQHTVRDEDGNVVANSAVYVYTDADRTILASLYDNYIGGSAISQPLITDSDGKTAVEVYAAVRTYWLKATDNGGTATVDGNAFSFTADTNVKLEVEPLGVDTVQRSDIPVKGDLLVGTGTPFVLSTVDRLPVGTNGQVLTSNSSTATGLEWSSNPGITYDTPGASNVGDVASAGGAVTVSRSDHRHGRETFTASPAVVAAAAVAGTASTVNHGDHQHAHGTGYAGGHTDAAGTVAAPALTFSTTNAAGAPTTAVGTGATIALFDATSPTTQAIGDAAAVGSAGTATRRDHKHAMPAFATNAVVLGSAAAAGVATTLMRTDDTIAAFDATAPTTSAVGDAAATGSAAKAARRDHAHGREAFATNAIVLGSAAAAGVATTLMRRDDTIAAFDATSPSTQAIGDTAVVGTAAFAARRDHKHAMPAFGTPSAVGTANSAGSSASLPHLDHVHQADSQLLAETLASSGNTGSDVAIITSPSITVAAGTKVRIDFLLKVSSDTTASNVGDYTIKLKYNGTTITSVQFSNLTSSQVTATEGFANLWFTSTTACNGMLWMEDNNKSSRNGTGTTSTVAITTPGTVTLTAVWDTTRTGQDVTGQGASIILQRA